MEFDYRSIMSGQRRDAVGAAVRAGLRLASGPYGWAVAHRNRRFDSGRREVIRCGVPVISVGNLTTGGTGKTPIVCRLAQWFLDRQIRVAIVSRGYGRGSEQSNDEAKELHARLPDVPHVQDPDRAGAAAVALDDFDAQLIIMDDGFQHRRLYRDLDLVVIDATCPFGYGYLLPRGLLRESIAGLRRANLVVITRCSTVEPAALNSIESSIREINATTPIIYSDHRPTTLLQYPDQRHAIESLGGASVAVVCAIGNPAGFEQTVRDCGANLVASQRLADHDPYDAKTVRKLESWIGQLDHQISRVICTHKDLVKLQTDQIAGKPLQSVLIDLEISKGQAELEQSLNIIAAEVNR